MWMVLGLLVTSIEILLYSVRPTWLARLTLFTVREHRFELRRPRRSAVHTVGYRDAAHAPTALPAIPPRTELGDAVMFADGARVVVRRAFERSREHSWLLSLLIERQGNDIAVRARQGFVPLSLALLLPAFAMTVSQTTADALVVLVIAAVMPIAVAIQSFFGAGSRDAVVHVAFARIEQLLRRELEEP